jgi:hypothetical protein
MLLQDAVGLIPFVRFSGAVEDPFLSYNDLYGGSDELWKMGLWVGRGIRRSSMVLSGAGRGLTEPQRSLLSSITP